jgi:hypothetical protein
MVPVARSPLVTHALRTALLGSTAIAVFAGVLWLAGEPGRAQQGETAARGAAQPTPRLSDGTVNLGRVPGEKGTWRVPYIQNMAMRVVGPDGQLLSEIVKAQQTARAGGVASTGRGGAKSEPWMPWMPWSAAIYDYNSANDSKYDP